MPFVYLARERGRLFGVRGDQSGAASRLDAAHQRARLGGVKLGIHYPQTNGSRFYPSNPYEFAASGSWVLSVLCFRPISCDSSQEAVKMMRPSGALASLPPRLSPSIALPTGNSWRNSKPASASAGAQALPTT